MITISLTVGICILSAFAPSADGQETARKPKLILDADTANEIDDLYAIVRTLRQDKFEVLGLTSAQWFHYLGDPDSVQASQKLNEDLELHVMSATVSGALTFDRDDTFRRQEQMGKLGAYLTRRWKARTPTAKTWIMWDVAAIQAMVHPDMAGEEQVTTPPENEQRQVWMYHTIDVDRMRTDFWAAAMSAPKGK